MKRHMHDDNRSYDVIFQKSGLVKSLNNEKLRAKSSRLSLDPHSNI